MPGEHSLRVSLIGKLVRNRRWLGATLLGLARLAAGDRGAAAGAADRRAALPGQRPGPAALARGDAAGGEAGAARVPRRGGDRRRCRRGRLGGAGPHHRPRRRRRRSRWRWSWSRSRSRLPTCCAAGRGAAGTLAVISAGFGYAWTAIASKLLTDELAAGALLVAVGLARHRGRLGGTGAAQRDERAAAPAGDPGGAGDVRGPGARAGDPGAADLRRVVEHHARSAAPLWSPSSSLALAGTIAAGGLAGGRRGDRDRPRGRLIEPNAGYLERPLSLLALRPPSATSHRSNVPPNAPQPHPLKEPP